MSGARRWSAMAEAPGQMALSLALPETPATMVGFLAAASNAEARRWLAQEAAWPAGRLALFGEAGCGKTHLARAWAGRDGLVMGGAGLCPPDGPPAASRVVVDDADAAPALALLHWLNVCAAQGCALLLVARVPPSRFAQDLPDLVSRLRATLSVAIDVPEQDLLRDLLASALANRQLVVAPTVQDWLLTRLPREAGAILAAVAALDAASLREGAPITRGFARAVLAPMLAVEDAVDGTASMPQDDPPA